jgi:hypothetical protein
MVNIWRRSSMAEAVQRREHFYATIEDKPGEAYRLLAQLSARRVNLLAFTAFPIQGGESQLDLFPEDSDQLLSAASEEGITLVGPRKAFLIQGEDRPGALIDHHRRLSEAGINVRAANGVASSSGEFGNVLWVKHEDYEKAAQALGV